jgi:hypothetical protein
MIPISPFSDSYGHYFRGYGISSTISAGTTNNVDHLVSAQRYINGCHLILDGHAIGDTLKFQVVDVNNILGYGAGVVLNEFATNWQVVTDKQDQGVFKIEYPARINAGLYIRIRYTSTGEQDVVVKCNLFLHERSGA